MASRSLSKPSLFPAYLYARDLSHFIKHSPGYSAFNVIAGSTLAARHAGTQQAIADTPRSNAVTPM
jgi:hypothetical protein